MVYLAGSFTGVLIPKFTCNCKVAKDSKRKMTTPPFLKPGDKVAIVCTARKISRAEIEPVVNVLQSWGLEVVVGDTVRSERHQFACMTIKRQLDIQTTSKSFLPTPNGSLVTAMLPCCIRT